MGSGWAGRWSGRLALAGLVGALVLGAVPLTAGAETGPQVHFDPTPEPPSTPALVVGEPAACGQGSWLAGSVEICDGEIVYRDYVYDAFGASSYPAPHPAFRYDPVDMPVSFAYGAYPPAGGQVRPLPDEEANLGDIVAVRISRGAGGLDVTMELNTLLDPASTRAVVVVDSDPASGSGGGALPGLVANPDFNRAPRISGWNELIELTCDAETNLCTGQLADVGAPIRVWALTARASDDVVLNVAFRGVHEGGFWWDAKQAGALHDGDITQFGLTIDPADLEAGTTRRAETPAGVPLQRVYVSEHPLGEGVSSEGADGPATNRQNPVGAGAGQAFTMLGRYQPYGFFLPPGGGPHGAQLALHGLSENHGARIVNAGGGWTANGFTETFGVGEDRVIVAPLGRGWRGWYSGHSERDVLDALGDAMANYPVDPDRLVVSGLSMGGFGTLWLGAMHPHLWAAAINWVGWTGDFLNGNPLADGYDSSQFGSNAGARANAVDLVGNLRRVPIANVYGALDPLVHVNQAVALRDALADHLVPSAFWLHPTGEHLSSAIADDWGKEADYSSGRTVVRDPRTVSFRTAAEFFMPELGLVPDHAYWVRNIVPADDGYADVLATSEGCGSTDPVLQVTSAVRPYDPPPLFASQAQHVDEVGTVGGTAEPRLSVTTANVGRLVVETGDGAHGACLGPGPVDLTIDADTQLEIRFDDGRVVTVPAGQHELQVPAVAELAPADPKKPGPPASTPGRGPGGTGPPGGPGKGGPSGGDGTTTAAPAPAAASRPPLPLGLLALAAGGALIGLRTSSRGRARRSLT